MLFRSINWLLTLKKTQRIPIHKAGVNHKALKVISQVLQTQPELATQFVDAYKNAEIKRAAGTVSLPISNFMNAQVKKKNNVIQASPYNNIINNNFIN